MAFYDVASNICQTLARGRPHGAHPAAAEDVGGVHAVVHLAGQHHVRR